VLDQPDLIDEVARRVAPSLDRAADPTDHLIAVDTLLALSGVRPELDITSACERWRHSVVLAGRPIAGQPRVHRPELAAWHSTIWVDCMHTDGPGLAALGLRDDAVVAAEEYAAVLQRSDGLFDHGYDIESGRSNGVAWGRGQAWAMLGLVDTCHPADDSGLRQRLTSLLDALGRHEENGAWHTVVDEPASPIELSAGAYIAWVVPRAVRYGLAEQHHAEMADRAFDRVLRELVDGALTVSEASPVGDIDSYASRAVGIFPWGQAPVLHALLDRVDQLDRVALMDRVAEEDGR